MAGAVSVVNRGRTLRPPKVECVQYVAGTGYKDNILLNSVDREPKIGPCQGLTRNYNYDWAGKGCNCTSSRNDYLHRNARNTQSFPKNAEWGNGNYLNVHVLETLCINSKQWTAIRNTMLNEIWHKFMGIGLVYQETLIRSSATVCKRLEPSTFHQEMWFTKKCDGNLGKILYYTVTGKRIFNSPAWHMTCDTTDKIFYTSLKADSM